ncbi:Eukaryotic aspartyl protease family protein [Forsythia ovata]|uniref:Eukaryotic aspartyl protease family protein n=1 Tax=Forsythia ovata TaxID=205694 RepID=A0ABD1R2G6_9LAMI
MDIRRVLVLMMLLIDLICVVKGNVLFKVQHKYGSLGQGRFALSALHSHDSSRHFRMLAAVDFQLGGNGRPTGTALYYTKLAIGTPLNYYHVHVDTGSDVLWVNCEDCNMCPEKSHLKLPLKKYNRMASSTGKEVTCDQEFCSAASAAIHVPNSNCRGGRTCNYSVSYGDGSTIEGYFVRDYIRLDEVSGNLQTTTMDGSIAFGCSVRGLGSPSTAVDGIIGFGQGNISILSQLASLGKTKKVFSHCLDGSNGGGMFAIGELVQPKVNSTPLVPNAAHYNVIMKAVEVGGQFLDLPTYLFDTRSRGRTIIDSGTTLAYLPAKVYEPLIEKMMAWQPCLKTHIVENHYKCFFYCGNVDDGFPVVTFHFEDSLSLSVYPHDYLFKTRNKEYCIGWQNSGLLLKDIKRTTLLGDIVLKDKLVLYDLENQRMGWTQYNCSSSIKVKDEESGNIYAVSAHDLSSTASSLWGDTISTFLFSVAVLLNMID